MFVVALPNRINSSRNMIGIQNIKKGQHSQKALEVDLRIRDGRTYILANASFILLAYLYHVPAFNSRKKIIFLSGQKKPGKMWEPF